MRFSDHGSHTPVTAGRYGDQSAVVTFGPGRPVHFDIQVPGDARQVRADEASFTLRGPDGPIPGASFAEGALMVAPAPSSARWNKAPDRDRAGEIGLRGRLFGFANSVYCEAFAMAFVLTQVYLKSRKID